MFSPWYHWSGRGDPEDHCCINLATYGPGGVFTMTDRGRDALTLESNRMTVGPSSITWQNGALEFRIDERAAPPQFGSVQARVRIVPAALTDVELALTPDGAHVWRPFAPIARIEVDMDRPGWNWSGHGYFDSNFGTRPLETDFSTWTWGRFPTGDGATCFYDAQRTDGGETTAAVRFDAEGGARMIAPPPAREMRKTLWRLPRGTRGDADFQPRQVMGMLDAPFYSRAMVETRLDGERTVGVHEALDLRRYAKPWLKPMIALRVPRRRRWSD